MKTGLTYEHEATAQPLRSGLIVRRLGKWLRRYAWCIYIGGAFSAAGWHCDMWQFYAAILPIHILVAWGRDA